MSKRRYIEELNKILLTSGVKPLKVSFLDRMLNSIGDSLNDRENYLLNHDIDKFFGLLDKKIIVLDRSIQTADDFCEAEKLDVIKTVLKDISETLKYKIEYIGEKRKLSESSVKNNVELHFYSSRNQIDKLVGNYIHQLREQYQNIYGQQPDELQEAQYEIVKNQLPQDIKYMIAKSFQVVLKNEISRPGIG